MSLLLISQAYSLSEDEDDNVSGRSENLKIKTVQSSENSLKCDSKSKQMKRKFQRFKYDFRHLNSIENPDLFSQWPFTHFKIVFNLKSEKEQKGWRRENNDFVFYENINLGEAETLQEEHKQLQPTTRKNLETEKNERKPKLPEEDDIFTSSFMDLLDRMENESVQKMEEYQEGYKSKLPSPEESKHDQKQQLKTGGPKTTSDTAKFAKPKPFGGKIQPKNQCIMCLKQLSHPSQLERHIRIHIQEKPFSCSICGASFAQLSNVNVHKNIHTKRRPYQCNVCNKCFKCKRDLKNHENVHSEERPYHCLVCNKSFKLRKVLKNHEITHTGEKIHLCQICNKSFSRLDILKRHERIHTGEKPYQCSICGKRFALSGTLKSHQRIHLKKEGLAI